LRTAVNGLQLFSMSIVTKTGDDGTTGLLFNRRVPKNHPRVEAYGTCDELNAALGMARALLNQSPASTVKKEMAWQIQQIQKKLIDLMGELGTLPDDRERYLKAGHHFIAAADIDLLTQWAHAIEAQKPSFEGWSTPGANPPSAALDVARTTCRRAERRVIALGDEARKLHGEVVRFLNRLSDLLWLMARQTESETH